MRVAAKLRQLCTDASVLGKRRKEMLKVDERGGWRLRVRRRGM